MSEEYENPESKYLSIKPLCFICLENKLNMKKMENTLKQKHAELCTKSQETQIKTKVFSKWDQDTKVNKKISKELKELNFKNLISFGKMILII